MPRSKKVRSGFEGKVLVFGEENNLGLVYEPFSLSYILPAKKRRYTPDWVLPNGIIIETKGLFKYVDREKHLLVREYHPELDIRFMFMRNNKLTKTSKKRYSDWCEDNGFLYAIGYEIPKEWWR